MSEKINLDPNKKLAYFITGTDTGVGKTLITCALLHAFAQTGKSVVGMKPVAAGCTTVNVWPATVIVAIRPTAPVLAV